MEQTAMPRARDPDIRISTLSGQFAVREMLKEMTQALRNWGVASDEIENIEIALAEALNNVVEHAYGFQDGYPIELALQRDSAGLICLISDEGKAIPNECLPPGTLIEPGDVLEDLPEGGFGWYLIRTLADSLQYQRAEQRNQLSVHFPISQPSPSDSDN